jgi:hypothetical protein
MCFLLYDAAKRNSQLNRVRARVACPEQSRNATHTERSLDAHSNEIRQRGTSDVVVVVSVRADAGAHIARRSLSWYVRAWCVRAHCDARAPSRA